MAHPPRTSIRPLALAIGLAFHAGHAVAQLVPTAAGPTTGSAANGVPLVNIVAPNASGLSNNQYGSFNVGSKGLILNNSTQAVDTQLGGAITANPNLKGAPAKVILNQVVNANPTTLAGFIEVGGSAADVVIANPDGITCSGCGFVNTPRVTLATGTPVITGGALTGLSVRNGTLTIAGAGLDGTGPSYFDILSRAITVNGQINAHDLQLVAGTFDFSYPGRTATPVATGSPAPQFAIDASTLGGMYADRVRLVATEAGVGVRVLGDVAASISDVTMTAMGELYIGGRVSAARDVALTYAGSGMAANQIDIEGSATGTTVAAGRDLAIDAGSGGLTLAGATLDASNDLNIAGASLLDQGGSGAVRFAGSTATVTTTASASFADTKWNGVGGLQVTAPSIQFPGGGSAVTLASANNGTPSGSVSLASVADLVLGAATISGGSGVSVRSSGGSLSLALGGVIDSGATLSLASANGFTNAGSLVASGDLTFTSTATAPVSFTNSAGAVIQSGGMLTIGGAAPVNLFNQTGASLVGDSLALGLGSLTNAQGGLIQATNSATLSATTIANNGTLTVATAASGAGTLTAPTVTDAGTIQSAGDLTLNASSLSVGASGQLLSGGDLSIAPTGASNLTNSGVIRAVGALSAGTALTQIQNNSNASIVGGTLGITAASVTNDGILEGMTSSTWTVGQLNNALVTSEVVGSASGTSPSILNIATLENAGLVLSSGPLTINANGLTNGSTAAVYSANALTLAGGNGPTSAVNNAGSLLSGGSLAITGYQTILNNAQYGATPAAADLVGEIQGLSSVTLTAGNITNHGYIDSNGGITITANTFSNVTLPPATTATTAAQGAYFPQTATYLPYQTTYNYVTLIDPQVSNPPTAGGSFTPTHFEYGLTTIGPNPFTLGAAFYTISSSTSGQFYQTSDPTLPYDVAGNYIYRNFQGQVYAGTGYVEAPILAHVQTPSGITLNIADSLVDHGGVISGGASVEITGTGPTQANVTLADYQLNENTYQVYGRETWIETQSTGGGVAYLSDYGLVNPMSAFVCTTNPCTQVQSNVPVSTLPASLVTGNLVLSNTNTVLATTGYIPSATPIARSITPGASGQNAAVVNLPGLTLTLPGNPNGLFIVNPNPSAGYLIETNPLYTALSTTPAVGSNVLITGLGLDPGTVIQRLGDPNYENFLVQQQIEAQTGANLIAGDTSQPEEMLQLLDNGVFEGKSLNLSLGVALTPGQVAALKEDVVWLVQTVVDGHTVLAPVVYLASATRADAANSTQIVATNMAVSNGGTFTNTGSTVNVADNLSIQTQGNIANTGGTISGGNVTIASSGGNITNTTTVVRTGDSANYNDNIARAATITATNGNLDVAATTGSITSTGAQLGASGDVGLQAGQNVNINNLVLQSQTTTTTHSGNWLTGEHTTTVVTDTQSSVGSGVAAGGNLSISAGNALNVVGSQVGARDNATVTANQVNIENGQTTDSQSVHTSSSGFTASGSSFGYSSSTSDTKTVNTNVVASNLSSGGNLTINATGGALVQGSSVAAGGDLTVNSGNIVTQAAQQTSTTTTHSSGWSVGASYNVTGNSIGPSVSGGFSDSNGNASSSTAVVSTLSSGGNTSLNAQGGTITQQGTQLTAGGNYAQSANTITISAAQSTANSTNSSSSTSIGVSSGLNYNAQTASQQALSGSIPSVGAPNLMVGASFENQNSNASTNGSTATVASIVAHGNVTSTSTGATTLEGTNIQAGNEATINAGSLDYTAAKNTSSQTSSSTSYGGGAQFGIDPTGYVGGAEGNYGSSSGNGSQATAVTGTLTSNRGTTINTTGNTTLVGTRLQSGGTTAINAGGSVNLLAAADTSSSSSNSQSYSGSVGKDQTGAGNNAQFAGNGSYQSGSSSTSTAVVGSISSKGGVTVTAQGGDVTMQGTNIQSSHGNIDVSASGNVNVNAATSTTSSSDNSYSAGLSASKGGDGKSTKGGSSVDANFGVGTDSGSSTVQTGGSLNGQNVSITSGGDTSLQGTQVGAQHGVSINTGGALTMTSAQSTASANSTSYGGDLGGTNSSTKDGKAQGGGGGQLSFNYGNAAANSVSNQNADVQGGTVAINTGGNMSMTGAQVRGGVVNANVGGNLTVTSQVDSSTTSSTSASGYVGASDPGSSQGRKGQFGGALRDGLSGDGGSSSSNSSTVGRASGIMGGAGSNVNVLTGSTTLTGAVIGGDANGTNLNTRTLSQSSIGLATGTTSTSTGAGLSASGAIAPDFSHTSKSTSSTLNSSVPGNSIQSTVSIAAVSSILQEPQIQTALVLDKGLKAALTNYGTPSQIPVETLHQILSAAGVSYAPGASAQELVTSIQSTVTSGKNALRSQLSNSNILPGQADSLLNAIGLAAAPGG